MPYGVPTVSQFPNLTVIEERANENCGILQLFTR
jgi:hypothetical protein